MKKMMLGFATCALILSSCSNNETYNNVSQGNEIGFGVLNDRLTAKAANDQSADYRVWATYTGTGFDDASKYYMNVVVNGTSNLYTPTALWPTFAPAETMTFYAFAPATVMAAPAFGFNGDLTYTVPVDGQEDLTVAASQALTAKPSDLTVKLQFEHMLSCVELGTVALAQSVLDAGYTMTATNPVVKFYVVANGGKTNLKAPATAWSLPTGTATTYDTKAKYFFMPQSIPDGTTIKIRLSGVEIKDASNAVILAATDLLKPEFVLPSASSTGTFAKGTKYKVNFLLGSNLKKAGGNPDNPTDDGGPRVFADEIKFTATATAWTEELLSFDLGISIPVTTNLPAEFLAYITRMNGLGNANLITGKFNITGSLDADYILSASALSNTTAGSKLTIDASAIADANWTAGKELTITVPSGWTATPAATVTKTAKVVTLTKN